MIARMIFVKVAPDQIDRAIEEWKNVCAPLMISQPGCLSEELLECNEHPDEFISLSNCENMEAVEAYRTSASSTEPEGSRRKSWSRLTKLRVSKRKREAWLSTHKR